MRESSGLNGFQLNQQPRHCPVCGSKMRVRKDRKDESTLYWYCTDDICPIRFYISTVRVWAPGVAATGDTTADKNQSVVQILKAQRPAALRDAEDDKTLARVKTPRDVSGMTTSQLTALVLRHGEQPVRDYAFNRLINTRDRDSVTPCLQQIAATESPFAARARSILGADS
jgi:hypothetical protein